MHIQKENRGNEMLIVHAAKIFASISANWYILQFGKQVVGTKLALN